MSSVDFAESDKPTVITIPYVPRKHFMPFHASRKRFQFVVAHRRAGKSVAEINKMIKAALINTRTVPPPRYAYIGPSFAQTKDLIWGYMKHYTAAIPGMQYSEGDLWAQFPNGARITLYGGAGAYERMRGLYFDGVILDEFPLIAPAAWSTVVRPCLADYRGWAVISGTSNGEDHFYTMKLKAEKDEDWDMFSIPVNETDALHPDEVSEMTEDMSADEYAREMLCSFTASVEGAYYAEQMNDAQLESRITGVPYDPLAPVVTWWDLGIDDLMIIWFVQRCGREIHVINYKSGRDSGFEPYIKFIKEQPYNYLTHILPHDVRVRELQTGKSRYEYLSEALKGHGDVTVCPQHSVEDGIQAVRSFLRTCWFDENKTRAGIVALRTYAKNKKTGKPDHKTSHGADAFRVGVMAMDNVFGWSGSNIVNFQGALRRRIKGVV